MPIFLTTQQYEVGRLEASGLPREEIARRVGTSRGCIRQMLMDLRRKLGVRTRPELAEALLGCEVRTWNNHAKAPASGLRRGDPVRITGGYFAGRTGTYVRVANSRQWRIQIGGGVFALAAKYVEPIRDQEAA